MQDYTPPKPKSKAMWPLLGLMMAVAAAMFAYVIGPELIPVVRQITRGGFSGNEIPRPQMELAFMVITWIVFIAIGGLIVAMFMPKKKTIVKEKDLRTQRELKLEDQKRRRVRARVVEHQIKKTNRERAERDG